VYLVNWDKLMLTDSRFMADSTILEKKVDTEAVRLAFERKKGQKVLEDYRGVRVFSAFERFDVFNSHWIIIVEIDEDEVITEHYRENKDFYLPAVMEMSMNRSAAKAEKPLLWNNGRKGKRIDMSEFAAARKGELLETRGVGPCTSVVIYYPGRFGYLSHISPMDDSYKTGLTHRLLSLSGKRSGGFLIDKILSRIKHYDVYAYEVRDLNVAVIANHFESLENIVDSLIGAGIGLGQVKVLVNPYADYANVRFDQSSGALSVQWIKGGALGKARYESVSHVEDLGTMVKRFTQYGA